MGIKSLRRYRNWYTYASLVIVLLASKLLHATIYFLKKPVQLSFQHDPLFSAEARLFHEEKLQKALQNQPFSVRPGLTKTYRTTPEIESITALKTGIAQTSIITQASSPVYRFGAYIITSRKTAVDRAYFNSEAVRSLPDVSLQILSDDPKEISRAVQSIPFDWYEKFEICWNTKNDITVAPFTNLSCVVRLTADQINNETLITRGFEYARESINQPTLKSCNAVVDIRFEGQLILSRQKKGGV